MKQKWQNYVDRYPHKWQWWLSGFIYGYWGGRAYQRVITLQEEWNEQIVEELTFKDAAVLAWDLLWDVTEEDIPDWLANRNYTFPQVKAEPVVRRSAP